MKFFLLLILSVTVISNADENSPQPIVFKEIDGLTWLISPEGKPFFAHGITHAGNQQARIDLEEFSGKSFLRLIAREYFRVVGEAQRKHDPDRLVFGDRFAFNTFDPDVVKEMLPYVDAIAIQPPFHAPFPKGKIDEIHELTGKHILLCDFAIRFDDGDKDIQSWKKAENSVEAGKQYADYVKAALATDYIVGVFWCNPVDTPKGFGRPGVKQGFFGDGLSERAGLADAVKDLNSYREEVTPIQ